MRVVLHGKLAGSIEAMPSKSLSHRALICAALTEGESEIQNLGDSLDIQSTIQCLRALEQGDTLDCGDSASTLRFLLPIAALMGKETHFLGGALKRPLEPLVESLATHGAVFEDGVLKGRITPGEYTLRGDISSQFVSGLMLALPLLESDSRIVYTTILESAPYVELTAQIQREFGVQTYPFEGGVYVPGCQEYIPTQIIIEGDWSHAAFFAVAGALGGGVTFLGLNQLSMQGDSAILRILRQMGAKTDRKRGNIIVKAAKELRGTTVDVCHTPDLVPALAIAAAGAQGTTTITGAKRVRLKESDRLEGMCYVINTLGGHAEQTEDGMIIEGNSRLKGGTLKVVDHRVAMAAAIAAGISESPVEIEGFECVAKSAPHFLDEFVKLGGDVIEQHMG